MNTQAQICTRQRPAITGNQLRVVALTPAKGLGRCTAGQQFLLWRTVNRRRRDKWYCVCASTYLFQVVPACYDRMEFS